MHTRTYIVPRLYTNDQRITVALSFPTMVGDKVAAGSWVAYSVTFDRPNDDEPAIIRGTDLYAPAGIDVAPVRMFRSLCGFLAYYGDHCAPMSSRYGCDHSAGNPDCPVAEYGEAARDALCAESERFYAASEPAAVAA